MKKDEIHFGDLSRILFGEVPPTFFIEVLIRTVIFYLLLVMCMRLMGKRMSSQLSRIELAALVSLAAAIGVPIQAPDRGIIPALIIAVVVVLIERGIALWAFKSQNFEKLSQGNISTLVHSGVMQWNAMKTARVTRERLLAQLRSKSIKNLGDVKRCYIEAGGGFTLIREEHPRPGLSLIPDWDEGFISRLLKVENNEVCCVCGNHKEDNRENSCSNCGENRWVAAVK